MNDFGKILVIGSALWYFVLRGVNSLKIVFEKLTVSSIEVGYIKLRLSILIHNPLLISIPIDDIVGDVFIQGIQCANIAFPVASTLKGLTTTRLYIDFNVQQQQLTEAVWQNIQTGDIRSLTCRFAGYIKVKNINIPVDRVFTFNELMNNNAKRR